MPRRMTLFLDQDSVMSHRPAEPSIEDHATDREEDATTESSAACDLLPSQSGIGCGQKMTAMRQSPALSSGSCRAIVGHRKSARSAR